MFWWFVPLSPAQLLLPPCHARQIYIVCVYIYIFDPHAGSYGVVIILMLLHCDTLRFAVCILSRTSRVRGLCGSSSRTFAHSCTTFPTSATSSTASCWIYCNSTKYVSNGETPLPSRDQCAMHTCHACTPTYPAAFRAPFPGLRT